MGTVITFPPPRPIRSPTRPPPLNFADSNAILDTLLTAVFFELAPFDTDRDRMFEDLVERIAMTVMTWADDHGLDDVDGDAAS